MWVSLVTEKIIFILKLIFTDKIMSSSHLSSISMSLCLLGNVKNNPFVFVTIDFQGGLSQCHTITHREWFIQLWILNSSAVGFLLQCGLWCCPGQKCSHQEAEQTFPEPDTCQEGIPGVGAHEMCQSQKCKWLSRGETVVVRSVGRRKMYPLSFLKCTPDSVYFWFKIPLQKRWATAMLQPC